MGHHRPGRPRHSNPSGNAPPVPLMVVFIPAGDAAIAALYPPPTIAIPVQSPLTADRALSELRSRPNATGIEILEFNPNLSVIPLLQDAARFFREVCPLLSAGALVQFRYGPGMPTAAHLQFLVSGVCRNAILSRP